MNPRKKSTRLLAKKGATDPPLDDVPKDVETSESTGNGPRGKKRKNASKPTQKGPPARKKAKTSTKVVPKEPQDFLTVMPFEMLIEIFSRVQLGDLWNLAQTNKFLRATLMNRSSSDIWDSAHSNTTLYRYNKIPMPSFPEDMAQPTFAELFFGKHCQFCMRTERVRVHHSWSARKRICTRCVTKHCRRGEMHFKEITVPNIVLDSQVVGIASGGDPPWTFIKCLKNWQTIYDGIATPEGKDQWLANLRKEQDRHYELAFTNQRDGDVSYATWFEHYQLDQQTKRYRLVTRQQKLISEHVKALGWTDVVKDMAYTYRFFQDLSEIIKLCEKEFTVHTLTELTPRINEYMDSVKMTLQEIQQEKQHLKSCEYRVSRLDRVYSDFAAATSDPKTPFPSFEDIFWEPSILDLVTNFDRDKDCTTDALSLAVTAILPEATRQLRCRINDSLLACLSAAFPGRYENLSDSIFNLATTVFQCTACRTTKHRSAPSDLCYQEIISHSCIKEHALDKLERIKAPPKVIDYLERTIRRFRPQVQATCISDHITVNTNAVHVITNAVTLCGLDPLTATPEMMDNADPWYECVGCYNDTEGKLLISWRGMISHYVNTHGKEGAEDFKLVSLTGEELVKAREP